MTPEQIKKTAVKMAKERGLENISRNTLCARAGIPAGSFSHVMGRTFKAFIRELIDEGHGNVAGGKLEKRRIAPELRKDHIVATGLQLAEEGLKLTRADVADRAGVSAGTVSKYFNTMPQLRRAVVRLAKQRGNATALEQLGA